MDEITLNALFISQIEFFKSHLERMIASHESSLRRKLKKQYDALLSKLRAGAEHFFQDFSERPTAPSLDDPDLEFRVQLIADMYFLSLFSSYLTIARTIQAPEKMPTIFDEDPAF